MKCDKARDLILTDYGDGCLDPRMAGEIQEHIRVCPGCRQLELSLRNTVVQPLRAVSLSTPSASVWEGIQEEIEREKKKQPVHAFIFRLFDQWKGLLASPRGMFASASLAVCIVLVAAVGGVYLGKKKGLNDYLQEQVSFMASLDTEENGDGSLLAFDESDYL